MLLSILRNLLRAVAYVFNGENLPFQIWDSTKVCSAHFQPSDFRKTLTSKRVLNKRGSPLDIPMDETFSQEPKKDTIDPAKISQSSSHS